MSAVAVLTALGQCNAAADTTMRVAYLHSPLSRIRLSLADVPSPSEGLDGAKLGLADNNVTGQFLAQTFELVDMPLADGADPAAAMNDLAAQNVRLVVAMLNAAELLKAAEAARAKGQFLFNIAAPDDRLREEDCRANVIHVAPTRSMLADALAQYLVWKRWPNWVLITGSHEKDRLFSDALRRAAKRFGAKILAERNYIDTGGARRTDNGLADVQRQMPQLAQGLPDHDVLVAADESEVFAGYLPYRTWLARPVAGSAGLMPVSWNASFDQWGAMQLQQRFARMAHRTMTALDMQAWSAMRMIGEAAAHAKSNDPASLVAFMKGPDFSLAAFKGQTLTLRSWNLQLRQPILLSDGRNTVSVSPQDGFLHQVSALDTLGVDQPETSCKLQ